MSASASSSTGSVAVNVTNAQDEDKVEERAFPSHPCSKSRLKAILAQFGIKQLKDFQYAAIECILAGRDVFLCVATGSGKSLCYQIPAMITSKITIVISPLISLMKDQVDNLVKMGIRAVRLGGGTMPGRTEAQVEQEIFAGKWPLVYMSPEKAQLWLQKLALLRARNMIGLLAIDEAHCCSQWGQDFRVGYQNILYVKQAVCAEGIVAGTYNTPLPRVPVMCLTATASEWVIEDTASMLQLTRVKLIKSAVDRPNLSLYVRQVPTSPTQPSELFQHLPYLFIPPEALSARIGPSDDVREVPLESIKWPGVCSGAIRLSSITQDEGNLERCNIERTPRERFNPYLHSLTTSSTTTSSTTALRRASTLGVDLSGSTSSLVSNSEPSSSTKELDESTGLDGEVDFRTTPMKLLMERIRTRCRRYSSVLGKISAKAILQRSSSSGTYHASSSSMEDVDLVAAIRQAHEWHLHHTCNYITDSPLLPLPPILTELAEADLDSVDLREDSFESFGPIAKALQEYFCEMRLITPGKPVESLESRDVTLRHPRDPWRSTPLETGVTLIYCVTKAQTETVANYLATLRWVEPQLQTCVVEIDNDEGHADDEIGSQVKHEQPRRSSSDALYDPTIDTLSSSTTSQTQSVRDRKRKVLRTRTVLAEKCLRVRAYHAEMPDKDETQRLFSEGRLDVLVATTAFGMGIDKSNIRRVIHLGLPLSLEEYFQQIGRAGRDGRPSECLTLWAEADIMKSRSVVAVTASNAHAAKIKLALCSKMEEYVKTTTCRRDFLLRYFGDRATLCYTCDLCTSRRAATILRLVQSLELQSSLAWARKVLALVAIANASLHGSQAAKMLEKQEMLSATAYVDADGMRFSPQGYPVLAGGERAVDVSREAFLMMSAVLLFNSPVPKGTLVAFCTGKDFNEKMQRTLKPIPMAKQLLGFAETANTPNAIISTLLSVAVAVALDHRNAEPFPGVRKFPSKPGFWKTLCDALTRKRMLTRQVARGAGFSFEVYNVSEAGKYFINRWASALVAEGRKRNVDVTHITALHPSLWTIDNSPTSGSFPRLYVPDEPNLRFVRVRHDVSTLQRLDERPSVEFSPATREGSDTSAAGSSQRVLGDDVFVIPTQGPETLSAALYQASHVKGQNSQHVSRGPAAAEAKRDVLAEVFESSFTHPFAVREYQRRLAEIKALNASNVDAEVEKLPPALKSLYDALSDYAQSVAVQQSLQTGVSVSAYMVFDRSELLKLTMYRPSTPSQFVHVPNMHFRAEQLSKYASLFAKKIQELCASNGLQTDIALPKPIHTEYPAANDSSEWNDDTATLARARTIMLGEARMHHQPSSSADAPLESAQTSGVEAEPPRSVSVSPLLGSATGSTPRSLQELRSQMAIWGVPGACAKALLARLSGRSLTRISVQEGKRLPTLLSNLITAVTSFPHLQWGVTHPCFVVMRDMNGMCSWKLLQRVKAAFASLKDRPADRNELVKIVQSEVNHSSEGSQLTRDAVSLLLCVIESEMDIGMSLARALALEQTKHEPTSDITLDSTNVIEPSDDSAGDALLERISEFASKFWASIESDSLWESSTMMRLAPTTPAATAARSGSRNAANTTHMTGVTRVPSASALLDLPGVRRSQTTGHARASIPVAPNSVAVGFDAQVSAKEADQHPDHAQVALPPTGATFVDTNHATLLAEKSQEPRAMSYAADEPASLPSLIPLSPPEVLADERENIGDIDNEGTCASNALSANSKTHVPGGMYRKDESDMQTQTPKRLCLAGGSGSDVITGTVKQPSPSAARSNIYAKLNSNTPHMTTPKGAVLPSTISATTNFLASADLMAISEAIESSVHALVTSSAEASETGGTTAVSHVPALTTSSGTATSASGSQGTPQIAEPPPAAKRLIGRSLYALRSAVPVNQEPASSHSTDSQSPPSAPIRPVTAGSTPAVSASPGPADSAPFALENELR